MMRSILLKSVDKFIAKTKSHLSELLIICNQFGNWEKIDFEVNSLSEDILLQLKHDKNVLYFIEILFFNVEENKKLLNKFQAIKSKIKKIKFPQLNNDNLTSNILYVGKSSTSFKNRLRQHFFSNSKATYALHLIEWDNLKLPNLKLVLHYSSVPLRYDNSEAKQLLEMIETGLHSELKPLLGRSGH